jgi:hypothetical protein
MTPFIARSEGYYLHALITLAQRVPFADQTRQKMTGVITFLFGEAYDDSHAPPAFAPQHKARGRFTACAVV